MAKRDNTQNTPTAGYSVTVQVRIENKPGRFAGIVNFLAEQDASLSDVSLLYSDYNYYIREITINCKSEEHLNFIVNKINSIKGVKLLSWKDEVFNKHLGGKIEVASKLTLKNNDDLARIYTPGVARVCQKIAQDTAAIFDYTIKSTTVAIVTDGSAVLGLGNIGPEAALPVMEGKAVLFKYFAGINAFPLCLSTTDKEKVVEIVKTLSTPFGGINLEDISAPNCFFIEEELDKELPIPVFHDDQHGTAIVVLAGLINSCRLLGKELSQLKIVVNGFGAGGTACTKMLLKAGVQNIIACDSAGIVYKGRKERMNPVKEELSKVTNPENIKGSLSDALKGADVFIGVSRPKLVTPSMVKTMNSQPIVFALANPEPEIRPEEIEGIAKITATGRSDYANQINNSLCFPGIFKGALRCKAKSITDSMKLSAAEAIASCISEENLHEKHIIPSMFTPGLVECVADAVEKAWKDLENPYKNDS
ncbi:MAG: NAD-dependent malic enzyme [Candidatus Dadabacteria bacterium]|nr:MAG: NAD-dependent malic enzyme [Candidatus Dadabacteria bacterium]